MSKLFLLNETLIVILVESLVSTSVHDGHSLCFEETWLATASKLLGLILSRFPPPIFD